MALNEKDVSVMNTKDDHIEYAIGHPDLAENKVSWYRQKNLRQLYLMMPLLFLGSTTLGYDGSLLNGLQTMPTWQSCK